jgi:putative colanic acid biosysnthesis UDP-glucose lipid carrier transferase
LPTQIRHALIVQASLWVETARSTTMNSEDAVSGPVNSTESGAKYSASGNIVRLLPGIGKIIDSLCLLASGFVTYYTLVYYSYKTVDSYYAAITIIWLLTIGLFSIGGLYSLQSLILIYRNFSTIVLGVATAFMLMLAIAFSLKISEDFSRVWVFAYFASSVLTLIIVRGGLAYLLSLMQTRQLLAQRVAYFGDTQYVTRLHHHIENSNAHFLNFQTSVTDEFIAADQSLDGEKLKHQLEMFVQKLRASPVDDVILALPWSAAAEITTIVEKLRELPVNVHLGTDIAGLNFPLRPARDALFGAPVHEIIGRPLSGWDVIWKSLEDIVIGSVLLIVLSPLLIIITVIIRIDSPGPAIFKQKRYGFNNRVFDIYKFRTMRVEQPTNEPTRQAVKGDARVTRIGRFLRRSSLDELPQLFNVLGGSMSLVGPRPHAVDHNEEYAKIIRGYFARHRVKPGITGLAQVKGYRGLTDTLEKMQNRVKYDVIYTENCSLVLDLRILAKTAVVCLGSRNAY